MHCPVLYHTVSGVQSFLCLCGIWSVSAGVGARRRIRRYLTTVLVWSKLVLVSTKMPMPQDVVSTLQPVTCEQMINIWHEIMDTLPGWDIVSRASKFHKELI